MSCCHVRFICRLEVIGISSIMTFRYCLKGSTDRAECPVSAHSQTHGYCRSESSIKDCYQRLPPNIRRHSLSQNAERISGIYKLLTSSGSSVSWGTTVIIVYRTVEQVDKDAESNYAIIIITARISSLKKHKLRIGGLR